MDSASEEEAEWTNEFDKSFKDQLNQYKDLYLEKRTKFREEKQELENTIKHLRSQNSTHQKGIQMRDKEIESVKEESEKMLDFLKSTKKEHKNQQIKFDRVLCCPKAERCAFAKHFWYALLVSI